MPGLLDGSFQDTTDEEMMTDQGAPQQSINFDVQRNPQDMQMMTDAAMYAPMLREMDEGQRKEQWPGIVDKMSEVNPKAQGMLDPTLPPDNKALDSMIAQMPKKRTMRGRQKYLDDQVERQMQGKQPISPEEFQQQQEDAKKPKGEAELISASAVPSDMDTSMMSDDEVAVNGLQLASADPLGDDDGVDPKFKGAPSGYQWEFDEQGKRKSLKAIAGGPADKPMSAEQAGKIMMMRSAQAAIPTIKNIMFKDGKVDWGAVKASNMPVFGGAMPLHNKGKRLAQAYELGIQAITRVETGAAMPDAELDNTRERYQCNVWDSEDSCIQKFLGYKLFINGYGGLVSKGKDGKAQFDSAKADAAESLLQLQVQSYKEQWMKRAMKSNPQATPTQLNQLFNKKLLDDPKFFKRQADRAMGKGSKLKGSGRG